MKISISNIAWGVDNDKEMYHFLENAKVNGIEIAPTRIFPENPYEKLQQAREYRKMLYEQYGLEVSSMQSIWFGRSEKIFEDAMQREKLIEYTKKSFEFANAMQCHNLVFGCPKNRNINSEDDYKIAEEFFGKLGELAKEECTVLALEANPPIYNTNFLNMTMDAFKLVQKIASSGIKVNYDLGTVIENGEKISEVEEMLPEVNHIHISEPYLAEIHYTELHEKLIEILRESSYDKYVSIEMKNLENIEKVKCSVEHLLEMAGV